MSRPILYAGVALALLLIVCAVVVVAGGFLYVGQQSPAPVQADANITPAPTTDAARPVTGGVAPDFSLPDVNGNPVRLSDLRGKVVVVNFWATWCGPCRAEMAALEKAHQQLGARGLVILGVNQEETAAQASGFADIYHLTFPMVLDSKATVGRMYRVNALPTTYFVGREGKIRYVQIGQMSDDFISGETTRLVEETQ